MKHILALLSVVAVVTSLQVVGESKKSDCAQQCDKTKTQVGAVAASEGSACQKTKTAVGEEAKTECASSKTLTYKVGGAACEESCSKLVKTLASLDGVNKTESCSKTHMTQISYDASKVKSCDIAAAIKKAGYKLEAQQVSLPVKGMACGACSSKVGKVLTSLDGVINGSACHESNKATVLFDPEKLDAKKIAAVINTAGFKTDIVE